MIHGFDDTDKTKVNLVNFFYPVGSIYETTDNSFDPNNTWGGTWEKIENKFLLASSSSHAIGSTGGAESQSYTPAGNVASHTLTVNELPAHNHNVPQNTGFAAATDSAHTHTYYKTQFTPSNAGQGELGGVSDMEDGPYVTGNASGLGEPEGEHTHNVTVDAINTANKGGGAGHNHDFNGTEATISNMPPYLAVNIWKRTA